MGHPPFEDGTIHIATCIHLLYIYKETEDHYSQAVRVAMPIHASACISGGATRLFEMALEVVCGLGPLYAQCILIGGIMYVCTHATHGTCQS